MRIWQHNKIIIILLMNFLMAISTTIGMTIMPILVTDSLGLSLIVLGIMEGTTEFLSNVLRLTNGILFDKSQNKRHIFIYPTLLAFFAKSLLLIPSAWTVMCSKILERMSNGSFASPRDAFVAENTKRKGFALALLSVSKTFGCVLGPLIVSISVYFMGNLKDHINFFVMLCFLLVAPTFICSFFLNGTSVNNTQFSLRELQSVFRKISPILLLAFLFFLGRFNDGLLMIYLKQKGFPESFYLSTIAIFNFTMLVTSPFLGSQIDHGNSKRVLYITLGALVLFNLSFYQIESFPWFFAIIGLITWGIQRTGAQIVFSSLVFQSISKENYGTAIGLFYIISGFSTMIASFICGYLANTHFSSVFVLSGFFSLSALLLARLILTQRIKAIATL